MSILSSLCCPTFYSEDGQWAKGPIRRICMKSSRYWQRTAPHTAQQSSANTAPDCVLVVVVGPAVVGSRQKGTSSPGPKQKVVLLSCSPVLLLLLFNHMPD